MPRDYAKEDRRLFTFIASLLLLALLLFSAGCPIYNVWRRELRGKAAFLEAKWDRQVAVEEAQARWESAKLDRQAELERAQGLAEAISAVKLQLRGTDGEAYLRYRWIEGLHNDNSEVIYVPTEANLPILEATRGLQQAQQVEEAEATP